MEHRFRFPESSEKSSKPSIIFQFGERGNSPITAHAVDYLGCLQPSHRKQDELSLLAQFPWTRPRGLRHLSTALKQLCRSRMSHVLARGFLRSPFADASGFD